MSPTLDHDTKRRALQTSVFADLTDSQLDTISRLSDLRHIGAGDVLCRECEFGQEAFVIAAGQVSVAVGDAEVARFGPGDVVGDWALFGSGYRSATLSALTPVEVVVIDPREIDSLLMAVPAASRRLGPQLVAAR